jgi:hypothetical protein
LGLGQEGGARGWVPPQNFQFGSDFFRVGGQKNQKIQKSKTSKIKIKNGGAKKFSKILKIGQNIKKFTKSKTSQACFWKV